MSGLPSPTDQPFVVSVRDGAIRLLSNGRSNRKEPLDIQFLKDVCVQSNLDDLVQLRNVVMFVLSFAGFLRSSEVIQLKSGEVRFSEGFVTLVIRKSKTDQLRDGQTVVLAELKDCILCPVKLLRSYFNKAAIHAPTNEYLFRPISVCRQGKRLVSVDRPISYSTYRQAFKKAFQDIVPDISKFSTHSMRSGGATLAANSGIPERHFQRHGRWKSSKAKDTYVQDSLSSRLSVSSTLGLAMDTSPN
jgi:integrase